jgi:hypothetical protein
MTRNGKKYAINKRHLSSLIKKKKKKKKSRQEKPNQNKNNSSLYQGL